MCRAITDNDPTTARRCASCMDKNKRSAANSAYYYTRKYVSGLPVINSVFSALGLSDKDILAESQSDYLSALENMPQIDQLKAFTDRIKTESNAESIAITYDRTGMFESFSRENDSLELKTEARAISETIIAGFGAEIRSSHNDIIKCAASSVTFNALGTVRIWGNLSHNGEKIGSWLRSIKFDDKNNDHHIVYELMEIDEDRQNKKLGTRFISHFDSVALAMGITKIKLEANLDIGGYAWAKHGYDWDADYGEPDTKTIQTKLLQYANTHNNSTANEARILAHRLAQTFDNNYPTPLEIAMVGYPARDTDNTNHAPWLGKTIMLESAWWGTRTLTGETHV